MVLGRLEQVKKKSKTIGIRFQGIKLIQQLFPQEYQKLSPNLVLDQETLLKLDQKAISLLNKHYLPCYSDCYLADIDAASYSGIGEIELITIGYNPYTYWDGENCWDYIYYYTGDKFQDHQPDWIDLQEVITYLRDWEGHPLELFPESFAYVWRLTGNVWLDHCMEDWVTEIANLENIKILANQYREAKIRFIRLNIFNQWFEDNYAVASKLIEHIINEIYGS